MIKVTKKINNSLFTITVESYLKSQAEALLNILSKVELEDVNGNFTIQIRFTIFTLKKVNDEIVVYSPDYKGNPLTDITDDLTVALWIQLEQGNLLNKLNLDGEIISFHDKIICYKGILEIENIYLERSENCEKGDSGWYIGPVDTNKEMEEYEAYYAYELLELRPSIIQVLALPSNYMVIFKDDKLEAILDSEDIDIYQN